MIGAGPGGLYVAAALHTAGAGIAVDVLERLPAPYGLVRYGVAPDHVKMKGVITVLKAPFAGDPPVRFLGNVRVGEDRPDEPAVPLAVLGEHYQAIVHASGCAVDRTLGVAGEDLRGSYGSGAFVGWYSGHPDFAALDPRLDHPGVAVVGAGNVALDLARMLARAGDELAPTDVPDPVLRALRASRVRDIHVLIRRTPELVRFTPAELRQIGELANADVVVHHENTLSPELAAAQPERRMRQNLEALLDWPDIEPPRARPRRIHLWFLRSPVRLIGEHGRVRGIVVQRNRIEDGRVVGTGEEETLDVGLVVRAIGYAAEPVPGLPFDEALGIVPNVGGRVVRDGQPVLGAYVTGWIKRGPTGVIGTNKRDAAESAAAVLADLPSLPRPARPRPEQLAETLAAYGVRPVDWTRWLRLDAAEVSLGGARGAERVKVAELAAMLEASAGDDPRP